MKIVIAHFGMHWVGVTGGVEKATCDFANAMSRRGHQVSILYIDYREGKPHFHLEENIKTQNILFDQGIQYSSVTLPWYRRVQREGMRLFSQSAARGINIEYKQKQYAWGIQKYLGKTDADIIVSASVPSTAYIVNTLKSYPPIVQMVHDDPPTQWPTFSAREIAAVSCCSAIQVLLDYAVPTVKRYLPDLPLSVIGLPVYPQKETDLRTERKTYKIVCVGNVCSRKNQKLLVQAFAGLTGEFPDWKVELWGSIDRKYGIEMRRTIAVNHLEGKVLLKGRTENVGEILANSDIFAIPSKLESFSISLSEAMAAGIPAIGFASCNGVNSLIQDGETGLLVKDGKEAYGKGLKVLMSDSELRCKYGKRGRQYILDKFEPERIWNQWENFSI